MLCVLMEGVGARPGERIITLEKPREARTELTLHASPCEEDSGPSLEEGPVRKLHTLLVRRSFPEEEKDIYSRVGKGFTRDAKPKENQFIPETGCGFLALVG
ncbi:hypothetical protein BTVI_149528 [Pitangus sulphuratus]|nr:hypothetical protein BTVI_149528 [Pitangus sulphuratus]